MDRQQINEGEWSDPANWAGPVRWLEIYFSQRDCRLWVPKRIPSLGWTLNLGHPAGVLGLLASMVLPALLVSGAWWLAGDLAVIAGR